MSLVVLISCNSGVGNEKVTDVPQEVGGGSIKVLDYNPKGPYEKNKTYPFEFKIEYELWDCEQAELDICFGELYSDGGYSANIEVREVVNAVDGKVVETFKFDGSFGEISEDAKDLIVASIASYPHGTRYFVYDEDQILVQVN
ncbi:MAG: hypothetical protein MI717_01740 [Spirochaetales bacterium]|nr:hypothetical protein [Spirochaetales bacterium]